jgi:hypothetical protein
MRDVRTAVELRRIPEIRRAVMWEPRSRWRDAHAIATLGAGIAHCGRAFFSVTLIATAGERRCFGLVLFVGRVSAERRLLIASQVRFHNPFDNP